MSREIQLADGLDHPDTPTRMYMDDPEIEWRTVKPNYDVADQKYLTERSKFHPVNSLEKLVENLVKTWEMESTHKMKEKDWGTVDPERYVFRSNGGAPKDLANNILNGNYILMLDNSPLFDASKETNASAFSLFRTAFPDGFAWELLELYSGPPKVSFTWRHWAHWTGPYRSNPPTGELMEMTGACTAEVDEHLKIVDLHVFFDPHPMLGQMMKRKDTENADSPGNGPKLCPFEH